jgi:hypothetical protein
MNWATQQTARSHAEREPRQRQTPLGSAASGLGGGSSRTCSADLMSLLYQPVFPLRALPSLPHDPHQYKGADS